VRANFKNFGEAGAVTYTLLREDGAWRIDDMAGKDWTLRHLLAELGIGAAR
jgi:hypothetical protein